MTSTVTKQLTDLEIAKIEQFCEDKEMFEAVKKVLLSGIYSHGTIQQGYTPDPLQNGAYSLVSLALTNPIPDEVLGQTLRAQWAGINALQNAFNSLESVKSAKEPVLSEYNEAI